MLSKRKLYLIIIFLGFYNTSINSYNIISNENAEFLKSYLCNIEEYNLTIETKKHIESIFPDMLTVDAKTIYLFFEDIEKIIEQVYQNSKRSPKLKTSNFVNSYYSGFYSSDHKMHYFGKYCWNDGHEYMGRFFENKNNPLGLYKWPTGGKYFGFWENDYMHGIGIYIRNDGTIYYGYWKNDQQEGNGIKIIPSRTCWGENKYSMTEQIILESWKDSILVDNKILRPHPGDNLKSIQNQFSDVNVYCKS